MPACDRDLSGNISHVSGADAGSSVCAGRLYRSAVDRDRDSHVSGVVGSCFISAGTDSCGTIELLVPIFQTGCGHLAAVDGDRAFFKVFILGSADSRATFTFCGHVSAVDHDRAAVAVAADAGAFFRTLRVNDAAVDRDGSAAAVVAAADAGRLIASGNRSDVAAPDRDIAAVAFVSAADAGAVRAALGIDRAAVDIDIAVRAAGLIAAADARAVGAAVCLDIAAIDRDMAAHLSLFAAADARRILSAVGFDHAAVDRDVPHTAVRPTADTRVAVVISGIEFARITGLSVYRQGVSGLHFDPVLDLDVRAVAENDVDVAPYGERGAVHREIALRDVPRRLALLTDGIPALVGAVQQLIAIAGLRRFNDPLVHAVPCPFYVAHRGRVRQRRYRQQAERHAKREQDG